MKKSVGFSAYIKRMRELSSSVSERNRKIHTKGDEPMADQRGARDGVIDHKTFRCPECSRVASIPLWCKRPICVHAWTEVGTAIGPDIHDGAYIPLEQSPNERWRTPGPDTWADMQEIEIDVG